MSTLSTISCKHCEVEFTPNRKTQVFCSAKCRQQDFALHNPDKVKASRTKSRLKHRDKRNKEDRQRRQTTVEYLRKIKSERGCERCGYNENPVALDFNHKDPSTKSFSVSSNLGRSIEALDAEIAKCEVLCANCHRIHSHENEHFRSPWMGRDGASGSTAASTTRTTRVEV